jgi:hypothetical protein
MANQNKIELFKQSFKGRSDVVPRYWKSKNGKSGFSPISKNGVYISITNDLILQHLKGHCILGVYPLLEDNTCHFIAADLDNHTGNFNPHRDIKEYYEVCRINDIPCYILRSKSGAGFHAYIFFKKPVPAWKARIFAKALLQEAQIYGENSSFDRLFPSQDKLSGKGFGNLIALPFQGRAAKQGNTIFLRPESGFTEPYGKSLQYRIMAEVNKVDEFVLDGLMDQWNLKKPMNFITFGQATDYRKPDFNLMIRDCVFIAHCRDDAISLSYMEWRAMISNVVRCKDGRRLVHELSKPYKGHDPAGTDHQIEGALEFPHPVSCRYIQNEITTKYCKSCKHYKKVTGSPAGFGYS